MNIETKWLEDFLSLATTQSFSRSAEERHMTQPAFSRRIRALEYAVGCDLVDRGQVPVRLTDEGQLFQVTARNLVSQLQDSIEHLQSLRKRGVRVIDFAVSHTLSLSLFPSLIQSWQSSLNGAQTRQLVANVDDSVQALKNGICDFLLAFEDASLDRGPFSKLTLSRDTLTPICRCDEEGSPLYHLDDPEATELPFLAYPKQLFLGRCVGRLLANAPHRASLKQTFESPLADSLKVMAMQGLGIAWVPSFTVKEELRHGFLAECGGEQWRMPLTVCLYRCNRALSEEAEQFWLALTQGDTATLGQAT